MSKAENLAGIIEPEKLWSRAEILSKPCPVPTQPGVYGWYFKELPGGIDSTGCVSRDELTLLYVGIAPRAPSINGAPHGKRTIQVRLLLHMCKDADMSTLRLSLGCLLESRLGIQLRRVGNGKTLTFAQGERLLSEWMAENAYVCWIQTPKPWEIERRLIEEVSLPLNLQHNQRHPFYSVLKRLRTVARRMAMELPVLAN